MKKIINSLVILLYSFLGEIIKEMYSGQSEQHVLTRIRAVGNVHYDKGIHIPPTAWRDFKMAVMAMLEQCEFSSQNVSCTAIKALYQFCLYSGTHHCDRYVEFLPRNFHT